MRIVPAFLARNWSLKLAALALAVLLWTVVRVDAPTRQLIPGIPVHVLLNDPRWAVEGEPLPSRVDVRFAGPARELIQLAFNRPSILIPVDSVMSIDSALVLQREWVRLPGRMGVTAEDIQPSSVRLRFEPIESAVIPFAPKLDGSLPDGLTLAADPEVIPERANVSGPASRIATLDSVPLRPIALGEIRESASLRVRADVSAFDQLIVAPTEAEVRIRVEPGAERVVADVPVEVPGRPDLAGEPAAGSVTLSGPESQVGAADPRVLRLVVDPAAVSDSVPIRAPVVVRGAPRRVAARPEFDSVTVHRRRNP
ncbi:MAG: hypothetical protein HY704_12125 [Gemmatimonadetes bacterium]|nr:hypothetical protein [Gemmatimonadota bacterium]